MSGHNKWSKIKRKKEGEDAKKSKVFSRLSRLLTNESKKVGGNLTSPSLVAIMDIARKENMPKDNIERAVKKGTESGTAEMFPVLYEAYGPGGVAIIIDALTDNKNRTAAEIRHTLSKSNLELATPGAASWAFSKQNGEWIANSTIEISEEDGEKLGNLLDALEESDDVQGVYTNEA
ncbi:MAG: YebC/PmpR family DNA-binding transcriptional regulator [Candidatus Paceibacterota bacterium]